MNRVLMVEDLCAGYGRAQVLQGVALAVHPGECVCVIGPNGAGKTTLLSAMMGVIEPMSGRVAVGGNALQGGGVEARLAVGMALVPERRELFGSLSVLDNLRLGAYRRSLAGDRGAADDLHYLFRLFPILAQRKSQTAQTLSGGEQQMLAIARALMSRPSMLLLDEPSTGLAPLITSQILDAIERLQKDWGLGVLLVEQNANLALKVSARAYVIETGEFVLEGTAEDVRTDPRVLSSYLGGRELYAV